MFKMEKELRVSLVRLDMKNYADGRLITKKKVKLESPLCPSPVKELMLKNTEDVTKMSDISDDVHNDGTINNVTMYKTRQRSFKSRRRSRFYIRDRPNKNYALRSTPVRETRKLFSLNITHPKPPYTYKDLIVLALRNSLTGKLSHPEICDFISYHFPYYRTTSTQWIEFIKLKLKNDKNFDGIMKTDSGPYEQSFKKYIWYIKPAYIDEVYGALESIQDKEDIKMAMLNPGDFEKLEKGEIKMNLMINNSEKVKVPETEDNISANESASEKENSANCSTKENESTLFIEKFLEKLDENILAIEKEENTEAKEKKFEEQVKSGEEKDEDDNRKDQLQSLDDECPPEPEVRRLSLRRNLLYPQPPYPYKHLIALALKNSKSGYLLLSEVYDFLYHHFPYYRTDEFNWRGSIRQKLIFCDWFKKYKFPKHRERKDILDVTYRRCQLWSLVSTKVTKINTELFKYSQNYALSIKTCLFEPENFEKMKEGQLKFGQTLWDYCQYFSIMLAQSKTDANIIPEGETKIVKEKKILAPKKPNIPPSIILKESSGPVRPRCSNICLIGMALKMSKYGVLPITGIYDFLRDYFLYFRITDFDWKHSIRRTLRRSSNFMVVFIAPCIKPTGFTQERDFWAVHPSKMRSMNLKITSYTRRRRDNLWKALANSENLRKIEEGSLQITIPFKFDRERKKLMIDQVNYQNLKLSDLTKVDKCESEGIDQLEQPYKSDNDNFDDSDDSGNDDSEDDDDDDNDDDESTDTADEEPSQELQPFQPFKHLILLKNDSKILEDSINLNGFNIEDEDDPFKDCDNKFDTENNDERDVGDLNEDINTANFNAQAPRIYYDDFDTDNNSYDMDDLCEQSMKTDDSSMSTDVNDPIRINKSKGTHAVYFPKRSLNIFGFRRKSGTILYLIALALKNSRCGVLTVSQIYDFFRIYFPRCRSSNTWMNSVRHCLSVNKFFVKRRRPFGVGNSNYWTLNSINKKIFQNACDNWFVRHRDIIIEELEKPELFTLLILGELQLGDSNVPSDDSDSDHAEQSQDDIYQLNQTYPHNATTSCSESVFKDNDSCEVNPAAASSSVVIKEELIIKEEQESSGDEIDQNEIISQENIFSSNFVLQPSVIVQEELNTKDPNLPDTVYSGIKVICTSGAKRQSFAADTSCDNSGSESLPCQKCTVHMFQHDHSYSFYLPDFDPQDCVHEKICLATGKRFCRCGRCKDFSMPAQVKLFPTEHYSSRLLQVKQFVCNICQKAYSSEYNVKRHMRVHYGLRLFKCIEMFKS